MTHLDTEHLRLYLLPDTPDGARAMAAADSVRAIVLTLSQPADPDGLLHVWQRVQADLALPAPAIAVNGINGLQLWFSVAQPVSRSDATAFVQGLRTRYLASHASGRGADFPSPPDAAVALEVAPPPAQQTGTGHWSAFVTPDLVRIFADEPWLEREPSPQAQADLLSRLQSMTIAAFARALAQLHPAPAPTASPQALHAHPPACAATPAHGEAARQFLLTVMNDTAVTMALRIEAAKALLGAPDA